MTTTKKEMLIMFSRISQLTPTPTLSDLKEMREQKDIIALTEQELKTKLAKYQ